MVAGSLLSYLFVNELPLSNGSNCTSLCSNDQSHIEEGNCLINKTDLRARRVARRLKWMNVLIILAGLLGVFGALQIAKGARLHELNFLHEKYNHLFFGRVIDFSEGNFTNTQILIDDLILIRAQPEGCLEEIGPFEELMLNMLGTAEAIDLCKRDIATANEAIAALRNYENGELTKAALIDKLDTSVTMFQKNSSEFEPHVRETGVFVLTVSVIIISAKSLILSIFGFVTGASVNRDYQRLSKAEAAIADKNRDLEEFAARSDAANRLKSEFLANMSHEIRTPMNGITGMAQLLKSTELDSDQEEYADTILSSSHSLLGIINDVLDISKIESGQMELRTHTFDLMTLLDQCVRVVKPNLQQKGLDYSITVKEEHRGEYVGDSLRLKQVLINIIGNAVKFTDEGRIDIIAGYCDGSLMLNVKDTGCGIDASIQPRIFDRFYQGDGSSVRQHGGTGLGLAISKSIVEMMEGAISVKSEEGIGSEFTLRIPLQAAVVDGVKGEQPAGSKNDRIDGPDNSGALGGGEAPLSVLIAEDNPVNQQLLVKLLQKSNIKLSLAGNGQEAIDHLEAETFDLVLMDIQMPVMNGDEAIRRIRGSDKPYKDVPVFVITADAMAGAEEKYRKMGANDYIAKPIHFPDFLNIINGFRNSLSGA